MLHVRRAHCQRVAFSLIAAVCTSKQHLRGRINVPRLELDEKKFRLLLNEEAMATEKTAEGIRKFATDIAKLEKFIAAQIHPGADDRGRDSKQARTE